MSSRPFACFRFRRKPVRRKLRKKDADFVGPRRFEVEVAETQNVMDSDAFHYAFATRVEMFPKVYTSCRVRNIRAVHLRSTNMLPLALLALQ